MNTRMAEATQLTRSGRLEEAMALLRGSIPIRAADITNSPAFNVEQGPAAAGAKIIDMVPPLGGGEGSWTAPRAEEQPREAATDPARSKGLRDLMDRLGQLGPGTNLPGLAGGLRSVAPAPLPDGARFEERTYTNQAGSRGYKLYVPSSYNSQPLPLIIMLHGCTQSPDDFAAGTRMNELAEEYGFLVAYPGQPSSANSSRCWNWFSAGDQLRDRGEPSLIAGITQQIMRDSRVETGSVFVAGLSAGGAAAAIMGSVYPDLYAATGIHSGLACGAAKDVPSAFAAMRQGGSGQTASRPGQRPLRSIVFHGDQDKTVNPVNADQVIAQSKGETELRTVVSRGQSIGGISYTRSTHADESGRIMLEQWILHGSGHAWSGGSAAGSYTDPKGPDASREMVRFFLERPNTPS